MGKTSSQATWETVFLYDKDEPQYIFDLTQSGRADRHKEISGICKRIGFVAQFKEGGGQFSENFGITRSWVLARDCYIVGFMEGTVHFAATAVECAINLDERMQAARQKQLDYHRKRNQPNPTDWLTLMPHNLREARTYKMPVEKLLDEDESLEKDAPLIKFIERRNKIAHGDYGSYFVNTGRELSEGTKIINYHLDVGPREAMDQFKKCSDFLYGWVAQKPRIVRFKIESPPDNNA